MSGYRALRSAGSRPARLSRARGRLAIHRTLVRSITGCEGIATSMAASIGSMPGPEHENRLLGEILGALVEMSIDLSGRPYSGGVIQIRDRYS